MYVFYLCTPVLVPTSQQRLPNLVLQGILHFSQTSAVRQTEPQPEIHPHSVLSFTVSIGKSRANETPVTREPTMERNKSISSHILSIAALRWPTQNPGGS